MNSFKSFDGEWDNKQEVVDNFKLDLKEISKFLSDYQIIYPCYILDIEDFDSNSDKVHGLYNDMNGFIFDYYFLVLFGSSKGELISIEIALD